MSDSPRSLTKRAKKSEIEEDDDQPKFDSGHFGIIEKPDPVLFSKFMKAIYNTKDPSAPETVQDKKMKVFEKIPGYVHPKNLQSKVVDAQRILFLEKIEAEEKAKLQLPTATCVGGAAIDPFSRVSSRDDETKRIYLLLKELPNSRNKPNFTLKLPKLPSEPSRFEYSKGTDTVLETLPSVNGGRGDKSKQLVYGDETKYSKSVSRIRGFAHQLVDTSREQAFRLEMRRKLQEEAERIPSPQELSQRLLEKKHKSDTERSRSSFFKEETQSMSGDYFTPSERYIKKRLIVNVKEVQKELQRTRLQHLMQRGRPEDTKTESVPQKLPTPEVFQQHVKEIKKVLRSRRLQVQDKNVLVEDSSEQSKIMHKRLESLLEKEMTLKTSGEIVHKLIEERLGHKSGSLTERSTRPTQDRSVTLPNSNRSKVRLEILSTEGTETKRPAQPQQPRDPTMLQVFKSRISETIQLLDKKQRSNLREKMKVERTARRINRELGVFTRIKVDEFVKGCEDLELMSGIKPPREKL